ncbi:MAG: T9SS type A sorting domain-containing protein [Bacteroidetes bacterium]|nr:T9SS type A sorting domain-containing protein [Bacteroidota bacterium]
MKLDSTGVIQWENSFGGSGNENTGSIQQTKDRGYIIGGNTESIDGNVTGAHGGTDYWVLKLDSMGILQWQKAYGGTQNDNSCLAYETNDGNYIVAGYTDSNNGNVLWNHGSDDIWILKIDTTGAILWKKTYGGSSFDIFESMDLTSDRGFVISLYTQSTDGDFSTNTGANRYVLKLDSTGLIEWSKLIPSITSYAPSMYNCQIRQCRNRGYILSGNSSYTQMGQSGAWSVPVAKFIKLDSVANIEWSVVNSSSPFGSPFYQYTVYGICESNDSGYVYTGGTGYFCWIVKLHNGASTTTINTGMTAMSNQSECRVFPNPLKDVLIIHSEKILPITHYEVTDELGRVILSGNMSGQQYQITTNSIQNGIYTLSFGTSKFKLVKQD